MSTEKRLSSLESQHEFMGVIMVGCLSFSAMMGLAVCLYAFYDLKWWSEGETERMFFVFIVNTVLLFAPIVLSGWIAAARKDIAQEIHRWSR